MLERIFNLKQKFVGTPAPTHTEDCNTTGLPKPIKKPRKKRKAQEIFGRVKVDGTWFEQRRDGVYVRRRSGRKWKCVPFSVIRDEAYGQLRIWKL